MNAIRLLDEQHDEVRSLFEQLDLARSDELRRLLFEQIADALVIHTSIEERIFYPAIYGERTRELLGKSVEEHLGVKRIVSDLLLLSPRDPQFDAKVKVCREQVEHHVDEERHELFPRAKKVLDKAQLETIGQELQAMTDEMKNTQPRRAVSRQTSHAAVLR